MNDNRKAFLDTIAFSELGLDLLNESDDGYNVLVGATAAHPLLFPTLDDGSPDYSKHPDILNQKLDSTAAGRYQTLHKYAVDYMESLGLPDFGHDSQDAIAIQQIKERMALDLVDKGQFAAAILRVNNIWASLPGSPYGQHTNRLNDLEDYYIARGGFISGSNA